MSRRCQENKNRADKLLNKFRGDGYPEEYPWLCEFLCKVKLNGGQVNTANQQNTMDVLWEKYGGK